MRWGVTELFRKNTQTFWYSQRYWLHVPLLVLSPHLVTHSPIGTLLEPGCTHQVRYSRNAWLLLPATVLTNDQRRYHDTGADEQGLQYFR